MWLNNDVKFRLDKKKIVCDISQMEYDIPKLLGGSECYPFPYRLMAMAGCMSQMRHDSIGFSTSAMLTCYILKMWKRETTKRK